MMPTYKNIHYHSMGNDQFVCPTLKFLSNHIFNFKKVNVVFHSDTKMRGCLNIDCIEVVENFVDNDFYQKFLFFSEKAEKIIVHGFWDVNLLKLLTKFPYLIEKVHWIIWGGDLYGFMYNHHLNETNLDNYKKLVYKNIKNVYVSAQADFDILKKIYKCVGQRNSHFDIGYSNMLYNNKFDESCIRNLIKNIDNKEINILVGNSSDPTNKHIEIFDMLYKIDKKFHIFSPLSYGDISYRNHVANYGSSLFKEKFTPITKFLPLNQYENFLSKIDVAIFNHDRQQSMGNIKILLQLGKTVYFKSNQSHYDFFRSLGLVFFDINSLKQSKLSLISSKDSLNNNLIIRNHFCEKRLIDQYVDMLN